MGQITLFPRAAVISPCVPVERVLVAVVDDALDQDRPVPACLVRLNDRLGLRYLPRWELDAAGMQPQLTITTLEPSKPGRRVIAETLAGEVIEQDRGGHIWIDDQRLQGGALVSFCALPSMDEQQLTLGERAGWLLADHQDDGFVFSVRVSGPVVWMHGVPRTLGVVGTFGGWMAAAVHLLPRADASYEEDGAFGSGSGDTSTIDGSDEDQRGSAGGREVTAPGRR